MILGQDLQHVWGRQREMRTMGGRDEGIDGWIRLKFILKRQCGWVFTGIVWLRIGMNCGFS